MSTNLVWFRYDLRTKDHGPLSRACEDSNKKIIGAYCFDPRQFDLDEFGFKKTEKFRAKFIIESITELRQNLEKLHIPLFVFHDRPENCLPQLMKDHDVKDLFMTREWTSEEMHVLKMLQKRSQNVTFHQMYDQFMYHPDDAPFDNFKEVPEVFTTFRKRCEQRCEVRDCNSLPNPRPKSNLLSDTGSIPSLPDLGLEDWEMDPRTAHPFRGGEDQAWERLQDYFFKTHNLATYKQTRNGMVGKDYSSKFSAFLALGNISARSIYHEVHRFEDKVEKNKDTYWMIFELTWRDYFKYISLKHGNKIFKIGGIKNKHYDWHSDKSAFRKWSEGKTKYDLVNANMVELANTGFMSNRGRQNVASYWAKELHQDWRIGAAYFESMLVDYDVHSNWGNWMYNAGVGNDPRDRRFNITKQTKDYDADGKYRRHWLGKSQQKNQ